MLTKKATLKFLILLGLSLGFVLIVGYHSEVSAASIDIRDQSGNVTTWGWWLVNIFAPFFVLAEVIKILIGVAILIFNWQGGMELILGGWDNLLVMWPGLLTWFILGSVKS